MSALLLATVIALGAQPSEGHILVGASPYPLSAWIGLCEAQDYAEYSAALDWWGDVWHVVSYRRCSQRLDESSWDWCPKYGASAFYFPYEAEWPYEEKGYHIALAGSIGAYRRLSRNLLVDLDLMLGWSVYTHVEPDDPSYKHYLGIVWPRIGLTYWFQG